MTSTFSTAMFALLAAQEPRSPPERVVLRTTLGDVVLVMTPDAAPQHAAQFLRLVRAGVYDGSRFNRILENCLIQSAGHHLTRTPLAPEQQKVIVKLPAEFGALRHVRGALSMARLDGDVNSAETSFSILTRAAPHLDGKYTVFGRVVKGMEVVDEMAALRGPGDSTTTTLEIVSAHVVREEQGVDATSRPLAIGGGIVGVLGFSLYLWGGLAGKRVVRGLGLLGVLTSFFCVFAAALPLTKRGVSGIAGLGIFAAVVALFRFMATFEKPADRPPP